MRFCKLSTPRSLLAEINAKIIPKASRNRIEWDGSLRIYVTVPPEKGNANRAVIELLAKKLGVSKSKISIIRGETSQQKLISIEGMSLEELVTNLG